MSWNIERIVWVPRLSALKPAEEPRGEDRWNWELRKPGFRDLWFGDLGLKSIWGVGLQD